MKHVKILRGYVGTTELASDIEFKLQKLLDIGYIIEHVNLGGQTGNRIVYTLTQEEIQ